MFKLDPIKCLLLLIIVSQYFYYDLAYRHLSPAMKSGDMVMQSCRLNQTTDLFQCLYSERGPSQ